MEPASPSPSTSLASAQIALVGAGLALLLLLPPPTGRMLVLPLTPRAARDAVPMALARHALLVGRGPVRGSIVVEGDRAALAGPLARAGALLIAAPRTGCGAGDSRA